MKCAPLLLLLFSLAALSCKKDGLTKETQKGANTFSCILNGEIFKPAKSEGSLFNSDPVLYGGLAISDNNAVASIYAEYNLNYPRKHIILTIDRFHGKGEYSLSNSDNIITYQEHITMLPFVISYSSVFTSNGRIIITKDDRANAILSGTFEFTASSPDDPDRTIIATSGRFDLNYKK